QEPVEPLEQQLHVVPPPAGVLYSRLTREAGQTSRRRCWGWHVDAQVARQKIDGHGVASRVDSSARTSVRVCRISPECSDSLSSAHTERLPLPLPLTDSLTERR